MGSTHILLKLCTGSTANHVFQQTNYVFQPVNYVVLFSEQQKDET